VHEVLLSFIFVFLAALPGRTTFILIFLAASMRPWCIIAGSIPAFALQCALGVIAGGYLRQLPHIYVQVAAGALFLYFAVKFWREARHPEEMEDHSEKSIPSIFVLFLLAELGDVSQLAIASRASQTESVWSVFFGSFLAMSVIVLLAVFAGRILHKAFKPATLQRLAAGLFLLLGAYLLLEPIFT
jgi:putative Ca2+/H+ antiporter (TMEM165/GDT1 family)